MYRINGFIGELQWNICQIGVTLVWPEAVAASNHNSYRNGMPYLNLVS